MLINSTTVRSFVTCIVGLNIDLPIGNVCRHARVQAYTWTGLRCT